MPEPVLPSVPAEVSVSASVHTAYDAVARAYDRQLGDELGGKPLDRALLADAFLAASRAGDFDALLTVLDVTFAENRVVQRLGSGVRAEFAMGGHVLGARQGPGWTTSR